MKIVIVEDEFYAAERLQKMLNNFEESLQCIALLESVQQAVAWFQENSDYDLVFMDIQLADGISLEIFSQVDIVAPIIFTTAYDDYALKAFEVNSVDYLLKPISAEKLARSLRKLKELSGFSRRSQQDQIERLAGFLQKIPVQYKSRFLVKTGAVLLPIAIENVAYFTIRNQLTNLVTKGGKRYVLEFTLDEIEEAIDPRLFYRINRQMLLSFGAVIKIHPYFSNRLLLDVQPPVDDDIIVSKRKVPAFKEWLQQ
ncbi:MAG: response regulator transcription factor [Candidatus Cloacimonetes bacterium]|nr:response regulator transcription factor [Candidatus Cloacimonadota bacterium]